MSVVGMDAPLRILYAEDSSFAVDAVRRESLTVSCTLLHCWTVDDAREIFKPEDFDLVILDGTTQRIGGCRDDGWKWAAELWNAGHAVVVLSSSFADGYPGVPFVGKDEPNPVKLILKMLVAGELVKR